MGVSRTTSSKKSVPEAASSLSFLHKYLAKDAPYDWIALDPFPATHTVALLKLLATEHAPKLEAVLIDELDLKDPLTTLSSNEPKLVVVDALHKTDRTEMAMVIKLLLKRFPKHRFVFLGNGSCKDMTIPDYLGKGVVIDCEEGLHLNDPSFAKNDARLLLNARKITPKYKLKDLIISPKSRLKIEEAVSHIRTKHHCEYEWGFRERHTRGHGITLLFHGKSGTGKTMCAEAIAQEVGMPIYQVDLSSVVSKWVGETEKNLKSIFRAAEGVQGILLFDEGDAIFGARTDVKDSQDKYGNMEVNYLLQEMEAFDGIIILSTNHEKNLDEAFLRRFTYSMVFSMPSEIARENIWKVNFPKKLPLASNVDLKQLAKFPLSGGNIKNCIRDAAAFAAAKNHVCVDQVDLLWAVKRELQKYGKEISREMLGEEYWRKVGTEWEYLYFDKETPAV